MNLNNMLQLPAELMVGETQLMDGQLSMCICPNASYGGGSGPLWAIENNRCQFTTKWQGFYVEGICRKVDPKNLEVTIDITQGRTWGPFEAGRSVTLHVRDIRRFHAPRPSITQQIDDTQCLYEAKAREKRFTEISIIELRHEVSESFDAALNKIFGCVDFKKFEDLLKAYQKLTSEINSRQETFMHDKSHPLMNARDQFRRKLKAFIQANS